MVILCDSGPTTHIICPFAKMQDGIKQCILLSTAHVHLAWTDIKLDFNCPDSPVCDKIWDLLNEKNRRSSGLITFKHHSVNLVIRDPCLFAQQLMFSPQLHLAPGGQTTTQPPYEVLNYSNQGKHWQLVAAGFLKYTLLPWQSIIITFFSISF